MAKSAHPMAGPRAIPEDDARRIVIECRKCLEEEAELLGPATRMRMLAIQRALEETRDLTKGFTLKAVNDQIRRIARGTDGLPAAVTNSARRADLRVTREHRRSFFTSYISGKADLTKNRRFNSYVRSACNRLGLNYVAVIGGSPEGQYLYYYLKQARHEADPFGSSVHLQQLTATIGGSAALLARRGWGARDVGETYQHARALEGKLVGHDGPLIDRLRFEVAIGLWSHNLVRGDLESAEAESAWLREIAGRVRDLSTRVVALRAAGTTALWLGRFSDARRDLNRCLLSLGDGSAYLPFASDLGASPFSLVASDLAAALTVLGYYREALKTHDRAREFLASRNDPFHNCYSLTFSSWIKLELGQLAGAAVDAGDLLHQASQFELAALRGLGTAFDGIIRAFQASDPRDGVGDVYRGLGEWQASGSALFVSALLTKAAKVWLTAGSARHAEQALEEAFEFAEKTGDGFYVAEMHRLRGDIQWICHRNVLAAETDLKRALEISRSQRSRMYELRAAMSLLRLAQERDDLPGARKNREIARRAMLLQTLCDSFAHEPASTDLKAARSLITD